MGQTTKEQIERIKQMEERLDRASAVVMRLSAALDDYAEAQSAIRELSAYYESNEWKKDFADDEQGILPKDLKQIIREGIGTQFDPELGPIFLDIVQQAN